MVRRVLAAVENLFGWFGLLALAFLMLLVTADSGGRYLFNEPISGVYEVSELYLMVAIVFLGFAQTQRRRGHVRVEIVLEKLPRSVRRVLEVVYLLAAAFVFGCIAYMAFRSGYNNIAANRWTTGVFSIPTGPSWMIAAFGAGVFTLRLLLDAFDAARGHSMAAVSHASEGIQS